ncbi:MULTISPECIES: hypothetical protein [Bordetella]|uniref:Uncharacterized protein n=2 Tax=Bordetella TaxID=517 RepID=A0A261VZN3_9BORD|nr:MULTISPECIES: hypothetical protein [Bordetella]MDM9557984.1 hypothetical protein [Bordetella petrii]OZI79545.1 hypothetical protein CAL24_06345 [Bordetella genomosp. 2]
MINLNSSVRLTDELERQLMLQAIEEQFRPRPMRALVSGLRKVGKGLKSLAVRNAGAKAVHTAA